MTVERILIMKSIKAYEMFRRRTFLITTIFIGLYLLGISFDLLELPIEYDKCKLLITKIYLIFRFL